METGWDLAVVWMGEKVWDIAGVEAERMSKR